ncbi:MAG: NADH-quinone oxidoreductase subunit NuoF [Kiritimatiellia bacterium]|jgi:NADH:ubiquinone oxidoreductase subunit F (NADH-binding)/(2Fe-2S) ferredoxin|nr:NADH-quinone oxidoreductase subunit NuoF [Kiritimatiellia bacterium]MDP6630378.1 NADH-quinone oxidoreductase subunit NuoF [Kiritimatiellia bacterium]MDP6809835.1 NADH-quinone oxidoreductase subunit NuoF [Kiritimatiellia bacterium]MDP7024227.1 NADH-quinone oxidoreductase subunit NuoF [Kiritimatiellia bacterium]
MTFADIQSRAQAAAAPFLDSSQPRILVGASTCGKAAGADDLLAALPTHLKELGLAIEVTQVGCLGLCYAEPLVELRGADRPPLLFNGVTTESLGKILAAYYRDGEPEALATMTDQPCGDTPAFGQLPMLSGQIRVVSRNFGRIDPENIDHYIARSGYAGLARALDMDPEQVIEEVRTSGLRGRGGAGFPAAIKWELCCNEEAGQKYMICNADEGDPGAFMDRSVLESDPHSTLEGMIIGAYAIGASEGYIYVRAEYPLAIERVEKAIAQATEYGLLGDDILGSGFSFHVKIKEGAGAFVCGEETAMLASIEGRRGMPRTRPPFPAQSGLFGKPTNINNVETLANVPVLMEHGGAAFAENGTERSRGTKTFALAGKIARTGLIEVPLGTSLRHIVFDIGGGIPDEKTFKAVQTGGPSGGCIPAELLDLPVDYEHLAEAGAIMGSGGMVVMDEDTCMVDVARYFLEFTQAESCGKCVPCRLGTRQLLLLMNSMARGDSKPGDIDLVLDVAHAVKAGSLCGLGQTAPNPILTTVKYFRDEYESHVKERRCRAHKCEGLLRYAVVADACTGCTACFKACPAEAITGEPRKPHIIDPQKCIRCDACFQVCKFNAITKS